MKEIQYNKEYFTQVTQKSSDLFSKYKIIIEREIKINGLTICDIGCAQGNFISLINKDNNCYGIDISSDAINYCKERFPSTRDNFLILDLNRETYPGTNTKFDLITMFDVIEHLTNYSYFNNLIESNLKHNGYLVLTTPNANSVLRVISQDSFTGEIDLTHINLFTPYTLDFFLRRCGLKKVSLFTPFPFYLKNDILTQNLLAGGQIFGIYRKSES